MCGICGYLSRVGPADGSALGGMAATLAHRGPDAERQHLDGPVALGHRRLSIIDLSEAAPRADPQRGRLAAGWS